MPDQLLRLASDNGIRVEYFDFNNQRIEALYIWDPECYPVIVLSNNLFKNRAHFRTVFGHELGHHFTTAKSTVSQAYLLYRDKVEAGRGEYRAMAWAARYLMPTEQLERAFAHGIRYNWELAEHFCVDEELVQLRLMLYFEREKQGA